MNGYPKFALSHSGALSNSRHESCIL